MNMIRIITAVMVGNALEFYDLIIYGLLSSTISAHFFPTEDKLTGIISTFAVFFIGYLARPLGAIFFGRIGDTLGRKPALIGSLGLMGLSTLAIGLLPTYETINLWAPILLVIFRAIQGFSVGGEFCGSVVFMVEHAPKTKRGFYGSFSVAGASLGVLLASLIVWLLHQYFNDLEIAQWAWRLPFLLGVFAAFAGWLIRRRMPEPELFRESFRIPDTYFNFYREYVKWLRYIMRIVGMSVFPAVVVYLIYLFMIIYMSTMLDYTLQQALSINLLSMLLLILLKPWMGKLSDTIGRRPVMACAIIGCMLWGWPYFWLLQQHSIALALLAQGVMTLFFSAYDGVYAVTMVEIVPVYLRFRVVAFAYAIALSIFGGATPLIASILIKTTHSPNSLATLLSVSALISLFAVYKVRETKPKSFDQGIEESIIQIVRNMRANGDSIEKVAAITGRSKTEIAKIQP